MPPVLKLNYYKNHDKLVSRMYRWLKQILLLVLLSSLVLGGCRRAPEEATSTPATQRPSFPADTPTPAPTQSATQTLLPSDTPLPPPTETQPVIFPADTATSTLPSTETSTPTLEPTLTPTPVPTETPLPTETETQSVVDSPPASIGIAGISQYPGPQPSATSIYWNYPEPLPSPTSIYWDYPEPVASATLVGQDTAVPTITGRPPTPTPFGTIIAGPTNTPIVLPTRPTVTGLPPTEYIGQPVATRETAGAVISLWHGWTGQKVEALNRILSAYQDIYPEVSFFVTYIPEDELRSRYEYASYYGGGPGLLLGPAAWGWAYAQSGLVSDISVYASPAFLGTINAVAVDTLRLEDQLIGLPYAQTGYVLYRNTSILPKPPATFDELIVSAQSATRGGRVGAYLERESLVSSAALYGLGGSLMDAQGNPTFNSAEGLAWFDLLARYEEAGLAGMHTNRDLILFEAGKIGYIIDGTWQLDRLTDTLGPEIVAVDRWPTMDTGQLAGYVQTEAVFMNTNIAEKDQQAALRFMGFLLTPEVQTLLGESGFIPTVFDASPRSVHVKMAMSALASGAAWPLVDEQILPVYWNALDEAINDVFVDGVPPETALQSAYNVVVTRLADPGNGD